MKSFISEDDIEQAICNRLSLPEYGWKRIECDARVEAQDDVSTTGRANPSECILPDVFLAALKRLNPQVEEGVLQGILRNFRKDYTATDMVETNCSTTSYAMASRSLFARTARRISTLCDSSTSTIPSATTSIASTKCG